MSELKTQWAELSRKNAVVYGVGTGSKDSHNRFAKSLGLPFPLLVDRGGSVSRLYHAWLFIVRRTVYGIDAEGVVRFARRGAPAPAEIAASF